jgi:class 3 adenylate cyclase
MFTDIVRSTNLVEAMGDDAWAHVLHWHNRTLRSFFAVYGGEEVNRIGDGFFVAFERAAAAIHCSVAIQRGLARHREEHGFSPSVRIGMHEAEATLVDAGDYQGKGVHEAARIAGLAEGDQILASVEVVAHLTSPAYGQARTIGLRGLSRPVHLVAIDWRRDQA